MAVAVNASSTSVITPTTSTCTLTKPANTAAGDTLIAVVSNTGAFTSVPTGWITVATTLGQGFTLFAKVATASEPSSYSFTGNGGSITMRGVCLLITGGGYGVNLAFPPCVESATIAANSNASAATVIAPTLTPQKVGNTCALVNVYFSDSATAITVPAGQTAVAGTTGSSKAVNVGWEAITTNNTATGTRTATSGTATSTGVSFVVYAQQTATTTRTPINTSNGVPGWTDRTWETKTRAPASICRYFPFWLYDCGQSPLIRSGDPYSTNVLQANSVWEYINGWHLTDTTKTISGTTTIDGVPVGGVLVVLFHRPSGLPIRTTRSASDGTYSFVGLNAPASDNSFFVVAVDPNGLGIQYNSVIADRIIPV